MTTMPTIRRTATTHIHTLLYRYTFNFIVTLKGRGVGLIYMEGKGGTNSERFINLLRGSPEHLRFSDWLGGLTGPIILKADFYSEGIQSEVTKGKDTWMKCGGNQVPASKSSLPVKSYDTRFISPATSCDNTGEMQSSGEGHYRFRAQGLQRGLVM